MAVLRLNAPPRSLKRSAAWTLGGNLCARGAQWGMLAAVAHYGAGQDLGRFGLALAVCNPLQMFAGLQLGAVLSTDTNRARPFGDYGCLRIIASSLALSFLLVCCLASGALGLGKGLLWVVAVVGIFKMTESWGELLQNRLRQSDQSEALCAALAGRAFATLSAFVATLYLTGNLLSSLLAMTGASLACLFALEGPLALFFTPHDDLRSSTGWSGVLALARSALPLGSIALLIAVYFATPTYFLQLFHTTTKVGVFVAVFSLPLAAELLVRSTSQAALPRLGDAFSHGDSKRFFALHHRLMKAYLAIGLLGLVAAALLGGPVLAIAFGAGHEQYTPLLCLSMAAMAASYLGTVGPVFVTAGKYAEFLRTWVFALVCLIVACLCWIPMYGVYGAAAAMTFASALRALAVHRAVQVHIKPLFTTTPTAPSQPLAA